MHNITKIDWSSFRLKAPALFICHASYEKERSKYVASQIENKLGNFCSIIIGTSSTLDEDERYLESWNDIFHLLSKCNSHAPNRILINRSETMQLLILAEKILREWSEMAGLDVIVDISVFPKDRLWVLIDLVRRVLPLSNLRLAYTEPETYNTEKSPNGWLSKGVAEVMSIPGFNGRQNPEKKSLLILNTGHENERMTITINNREPHRLILIGQGSSQHHERSSECASGILSKLKEDYGVIVDQEYFFDIDSRDFVGVKNAIEKVYVDFSRDYNILVASFGTKVQSVGALLACQKNRCIEAVYAQPQIYHRENYSEGVGFAWIIELGAIGVV